MAHDPSKPAWPGQQPTSFDPMTGQPIYAAPQQQQPQYPQQPQYGQQPGYPPQQPQYPQQPQAPQQWQQQPQQPQYGQQPQYPQQPQYGQPPQQPYGQQPYGGQQQPYPQQPPPPQQQAPWQQQQHQQQFGGGYPGAQGLGGYGQQQHDRDEDDDDDGGLRGTANATVNQSDRIRFIRMTYAHLFGAILVFAGLLWALMNVGFLVEKVSFPLVKFAILGGRWNWGIVLAVFMVVSWIADYWASHTTSRPMQYVGLALYVVAEALIFVPLLAIVAWKTQAIIAKGGGNPNIIRDAAFTTLAIFGALTASVFLTKKDFSFMRSALAIGSGAALMLIVLSIGFGFNLGIIFAVAMVLLAAGYILYQTSQVMAHYHTENYVAAALALFSSVALMFWYIIQIFMKARE